MKSDPFERLFSAARRCPARRAPSALPWAVESRVLAAWRRLPAAEPPSPWPALLRRALAASMVLAVASLCLYLGHPQPTQTPNELALADALMRTHLWP